MKLDATTKKITGELSTKLSKLVNHHCLEFMKVKQLTYNDMKKNCYSTIKIGTPDWDKVFGANNKSLVNYYYFYKEEEMFMINIQYNSNNIVLTVIPFYNLP